MNAYNMQRYASGWLIWVLLGAGLIGRPGIAGTVEEKYDVLQVGAQMYTNVTVTTKAKGYVFLVHSSGLTSVKITELPLEIQQELGYVRKTPATNTAAAWAKREIAKANIPQLKEFENHIKQRWAGSSAGGAMAGLLSPKLILAVLGVALLIYLFHCYCCMLICQKAGAEPGALVWLPVLQLFPLLRAAGMSGWWFLGFCLPVLNIVAQVLWCFNIAKARAKSVWVGVLLLLPITSLFAFLYLAFSDGVRRKAKAEPEQKIMTLQTA